MVAVELRDVSTTDDAGAPLPLAGRGEPARNISSENSIGLRGRTKSAGLTIPREDITAIVLSGGAGSRVGGVDKGWLPWRGQPLIERVVSRLRPQAGSIVVSANRNHEQYRQLDVQVVSDWVPGFAGPLAGLIAAWARCETPWVLVVPVDAPCVAKHLVSSLATTAIRYPCSLAVVAHDGYRTQPLFCILHSRARTDMLEYWNQGGRSVATWLRRVSAVESPVVDAPDCFWNMNQLEDFFGTDAVNL